MKRITMTQSLKRALSFALFCLCIFVYSQQASVLGSDAVQGEEEKCCKNCGTVEACNEGDGRFPTGWQDCEIDWYGMWPPCEVRGDSCKCK